MFTQENMLYLYFDGLFLDELTSEELDYVISRSQTKKCKSIMGEIMVSPSDFYVRVCGDDDVCYITDYVEVRKDD